MNILEEQSKCSKTQCFRTVSLRDNEIVILFSCSVVVFYFLKTNKFAVLKCEIEINSNIMKFLSLLVSLCFCLLGISLEYTVHK